MDIRDAVVHNDIEALKEILKTATKEQINKMDTVGSTVLDRACSLNHLECINLLLDAKADVGWSVHWVSRYEPLLPALNLLIARGVDLNVVDNRGWTPLSLACYFNEICIVRTLLAANAKVDISRDPDRAPLAIAIRDSFFRVAEHLLDAGAKTSNVSQPDWVNKLVRKRECFKKSYIVMYGVLRRRVVAGRDMTRVVANFVYSSRFDESWEKK